MINKSQKIFKSSVLLVATKWAQRLIGLVSLFVLARILGPEDFGIIAISFIVLSFFENITNTGIEQYILSRSELKKHDLNVAWTLNLAMKTAVVIALVLFAPWAAELFNEPRLTAVLYVSAIIPVITALTNPGIYEKQRNYEYGAISICEITTKILSFVITMIAALKYQSYWALVAGNLVYAAAYAGITYLISEYRPRVDITGIAKQWDFSKWMLSRSILGFTRSKIDQFIVGISFPTNVMGLYNVSKELTFLPFNQISAPVQPVFLSVFSETKTDIVETRFRFIVYFNVLLCIILPITVGFYLLRYESVFLLLGSKWVGAEQLVGALSILILTASLDVPTLAVLLARNRLKLLFFLEFLTISIVMIGQFSARGLDIEQFALVRGLLGVAVLSVNLYTASKDVEYGFRRLLAAAVPSIIATVVMALFITTVLAKWLSGTWFLVTSIAVGAVLYFFVVRCLLTWFARSNNDIKYITDLFNEQLDRVWSLLKSRLSGKKQDAFS